MSGCPVVCWVVGGTLQRLPSHDAPAKRRSTRRVIFSQVTENIRLNIGSEAPSARPRGLRAGARPTLRVGCVFVHGSTRRAARDAGTRGFLPARAVAVA